jgi:uncharacterized protein (DUF2249 family)
MPTIADFMSADHHACDEVFAVAEQVALDNNWNEAETVFNHFCAGMERHFRMEENELFPTLIAANGPAGPVQMMRMEPEQMNTLIEQMANTVARHDAQGYAGLIVMRADVTHELDVRGLPPPEPFEQIMRALSSLPDETVLQVQIHREPFPLYEMLRDNGYAWQNTPLADGSFSIRISLRA